MISKIKHNFTRRKKMSLVRTYLAPISATFVSSCLKQSSALSLYTWKSTWACCMSSESDLLRFLLCIIAVNRDMKTTTSTRLNRIPPQVLSDILRCFLDITRKLLIRFLQLKCLPVSFPGSFSCADALI